MHYSPLYSIIKAENNSMALVNTSSHAFKEGFVIGVTSLKCLWCQAIDIERFQPLAGLEPFLLPIFEQDSTVLAHREPL